jgi:hypothetical protein
MAKRNAAKRGSCLVHEGKKPETKTQRKARLQMYVDGYARTAMAAIAKAEGVSVGRLRDILRGL